jgi:hypothetical protein
MRLPVVRGVIDRRILVNYRVDPEVLSRILPQPFRPKLMHGVGVAGICLIRLKWIRPRFLPRFLGISSENAAHRVAVEWDGDDGVHQGVYIPRRYTSSRLITLLGGGLFPGGHRLARFQVREGEERYDVVLDAADGCSHLAFRGSRASDLPADSVFDSVEQASDFFERGSLGYSPAARPGEYDGMELRAFNWNVQPLGVDRVESSLFEDRRLFPQGSARFDSALLMRDIDHEWRLREPLGVRPDRRPCAATASPRLTAPSSCLPPGR